MLRVITRSSTDEVKTSLVLEGQACTHSGIFPPLCEDHGSAACQPRLNSCPSGQGETSINHYLEPNSERSKSCGQTLFLANSFPSKTSLLPAFLSVFPERVRSVWTWQQSCCCNSSKSLHFQNNVHLFPRFYPDDADS
ncbi:hypothetical protein FQA47_016490 [Oryzias melastigma]|uniref:Uncharacterized protein n=1 Tax=Oryzias melastigma TaxID=30732 RepID=A0A834CF28_ORYME|nr:hypothetical protein FQA47_016490 [Oryzias melastigma]